MSLLKYKKKQRQGLDRLQPLLTDTSPTSDKYFNITFMPSVFTEGKNVVKLRGGPWLLNASPLRIEFLDGNGEPIYYEVLDYEETDGSKVISCWIYNNTQNLSGSFDRNDNTPAGIGRIIVAGIARYDLSGQELPKELRSSLNVKWERDFYIQPNEANKSEIIFTTGNQPVIVVSESIDSYSVTHYDYDTITSSSNFTDLSYVGPASVGTQYIIKGPSNSFISDHVSGSIEFYYAPSNGLPTFNTNTGGILANYTHSATIVERIDGQTIKIDTPPTITQGFGSGIRSTYNKHTFRTISTGTGKITFKPSRTGNASENKRSVANLTITKLESQTGETTRILTYIKSNNITSTYELVNDVPITPSSSAQIKVPVPTEQRYNDLNLKLQYVNREGVASRYETIIENKLFRGGNQYIEEGDNLLTGSLFVSSATGGGVEISGKNGGGYLRSIGYEGFISASAGSGSAGFLLWSGSVLPTSGDSYDGVGIELHAGPGSGSLRFRTSPTPLFEVDVKSFILGDLGSQYISGSGGVIEISSSNFVVDNAGAVSANNITLTNTAKADFFSFKEVVINTTNTGSYYKYWAAQSSPKRVYCILDLSGVASPFGDGSTKEACMYVRFFRNPEFPISHILSPDWAQRTKVFDTDAYAGPILIETYGPAYSGSGCGTGLPNANVLIRFETAMDTPATDNDILIPSFSTATTTYANVEDWQTSGSMPSALFNSRVPLQVTTEQNDWVSGSFIDYPDTVMGYSDADECVGYGSATAIQLAPGGRYLFYPGANGWRLLSTTNYMNLDPLFDKLTVSQSLLIGAKTGLNAAAALQVDSNEKGILFPRMSTTARDAIGSPPAGLVIYNTSSGVNVLQFYNGSTWGNV